VSEHATSPTRSPRPRRWRWLWPGKLLTPRGLLLRAVVLVLLFAVAHLAGLREHTGVFSGGAVGALPAALGATYAVLYLAAVVVAPVLVLAALLLLGFVLLARRRAP